MIGCNHTYVIVMLLHSEWYSPNAVIKLHDIFDMKLNFQWKGCSASSLVLPFGHRSITELS